ncbi:putative cytochrome P450 [Dendryphion nanum]|uniref:Cytochrome P450 n=1 Tax=Dendryphion nanum TaxID=256645 RepID=A0A9P9I790_9PLEO|nr:putative cytochrome P450 [Dendryphion nanum]
MCPNTSEYYVTLSLLFAKNLICPLHKSVIQSCHHAKCCLEEFLLRLALAVCVYRAHFHPLAKYPGLLLAKVTNLYLAYHAWRDDIHINLWKCHEKYGNYVQYALNRISFYCADAIRDIYGMRSNLKKLTTYNVLVYKALNTLTLQDKTEHARRRRVMSQGFSDAALRVFVPRILANVEKMCMLLEKDMDSHQKWTKSRDMATWFDRLTFDIMSSVIFSAEYDTLQKEDFRHVMSSIEESNVRMSRLDKRLFPRSIQARNKFVKFNADIANRDIFSFFQNAKDPMTGRGYKIKELAAETATLIVAGLDTTLTAIASTLFYLSKNTTAYARLSNELRSQFKKPSDIVPSPALTQCTYLRACIDEALRMSPPAGGPLWREVQLSGATIDGQYIPAGYNVGVGVYSVHHNPAYYCNPTVYKPERWIKPESESEQLVQARAAYMPFSIGTRGCIGKSLALVKLTLALANLV